MNRKIVIVAATVGMFGLTACNTVNGAGKDLKSAGGAVSDSSGKDKPKGN